MTGEPKFPKTRDSRGDRRPYVKIIIHRSQRNVQWVMALIDTGAETSIIHGDQNQFSDTTAMIGGFVGQIIPVTDTWLKLGVGNLPPRIRRTTCCLVPGYIMGIDILSKPLWESSD